jgi:hypothetical protein
MGKQAASLRSSGGSKDTSDQLMADAYRRVPIGGIGCVDPKDANALEDFQGAFAAAQECESAGLIEILDGGDEYWKEGVGIPAIRFRRLK